MRYFTFFIFFVLSAATGDDVKVDKDICDPSVSHLEKAEHQAIACYAGKFLLKMLTEVIAGETKSVNHVRAHLLPYLGGTKTLDALKTDKADDPTCTVCYSDTGASEGLTSLRNELSAEQIKAYDDLNVCYPVLTERILRRLPTSEDGVNLRPHPFFKDAFPQVLTLFRPMLRDTDFTDNSCKKARATMPGPIKAGKVPFGSLTGMKHLNPHRSLPPRLSSMASSKAPFAGTRGKLPDRFHPGQKQTPFGPGGPRPGQAGLASIKRPTKPSPEDLAKFRQKVQEMREKRQSMKAFPIKADAVKSVPTKAEEKNVEATAAHESKEKNAESKQETNVAPEAETKAPEEETKVPEEETKEKKESGWSIFGK